MFRKIIAGAAVAGALTFGFAGVAGAATSSTGSTGSAVITPSTTVCSLLPQLQAHAQKVEARLASDLPKAQAAEAKAKAAGNTVRADRIAHLVTRIQDREHNVNTRLAKLSADCSTNG